MNWWEDDENGCIQRILASRIRFVCGYGTSISCQTLNVGMKTKSKGNWHFWSVNYSCQYPRPLNLFFVVARANCWYQRQDLGKKDMIYENWLTSFLKILRDCKPVFSPISNCMGVDYRILIFLLPENFEQTFVRSINRLKFVRPKSSTKLPLGLTSASMKANILFSLSIGSKLTQSKYIFQEFSPVR